MTAPTSHDHKTEAEIEAGLAHVAAAPADQGDVLLIVRRPTHERREVVTEAELDTERGLVGDNWAARATIGADGPERYAQLTLMNARYAELIAGPPEAWPPAGDQVYVDLDISMDNLPAGTRLRIGERPHRDQPGAPTPAAQSSARASARMRCGRRTRNAGGRCGCAA